MNTWFIFYGGVVMKHYFRTAFIIGAGYTLGSRIASNILSNLNSINIMCLQEMANKGIACAQIGCDLCGIKYDSKKEPEVQTEIRKETIGFKV